MLSTHLIDRLFRHRRFDQLLDGLAGNGMELPSPVRDRLGRSPAAVTALGLRRVRQLSYAPTPLDRRMSQYLLEQTPVTIDDPVAAAAIMQATQDDPQMASLGERILADLAAVQGEDGLLAGPGDRTRKDRALTSAFVLCLLAGDERFRQAVRFGELMEWFERHGAELDGQTRSLWRLATLDVPAHASRHSGRAMAA